MITAIITTNKQRKTTITKKQKIKLHQSQKTNKKTKQKQKCISE